MKQILCCFLLLPCSGFAQWGVSFHQSNLPFAGVNYTFKSKVRAELRFGTDQYVDELSLEGVVTYDLVKKDDYELYAGLGLRTGDYSGVVVPLGLNVYPFSVKQFGFHIELAPIVVDGVLLRGSWGIRYRFRK